MNLNLLVFPCAWQCTAVKLRFSPGFPKCKTVLHFLERPGIWWTPFASDLLTCVFAGEGRSQDSCVQLDGCEALGTLESLSAGKT